MYSIKKRGNNYIFQNCNLSIVMGTLAMEVDGKGACLRGGGGGIGGRREFEEKQ